MCCGVAAFFLFGTLTLLIVWQSTGDFWDDLDKDALGEGGSQVCGLWVVGCLVVVGCGLFGCCFLLLLVVGCGLWVVVVVVVGCWLFGLFGCLVVVVVGC